MFASDNNEKQKKDNASPGIDSFYYVLLIFFACLITYRVCAPLILRVQQFFYLHSYKIKLCATPFIVIAPLIGAAHLWNMVTAWLSKGAVLKKDETSTYLGKEKPGGSRIHLKELLRAGHTQVIGTTAAGKTSSVILPWAVQDIEQGRGLIIIDGKPERKLLETLHSHAIKAGRAMDFMVFSLANPNISSTYNPFYEGTAEQITERFMATMDISEPFYKAAQFNALHAVISLLLQRGERPTPGVVRELLRNKENLANWASSVSDPNLARDVLALTKHSNEEFQQNFAGLVTALGIYASGETAKLYNARYPEIILRDAILRQKICYIQLPAMLENYLAANTGKLFLQNLQSAIAEIQLNGNVPKQLFSIYLDDFNDYIYPGFTTLLNKSRSANVGIVFCHQSIGDLMKVGADFQESVLTNTNIKIVMKSNSPSSAELFAKMIGTRATEKITQRRSRKFLRSLNTGEQSVRDTEEYIVHPNVIKSGLGQGEAIVIIPHPKGQVVKHMKLAMADAIIPIPMRVRDLPSVDFGKEATIQGTKDPKVDQATESSAA